MLTIEMLPAQHGDCLVIEYGTKAAPHRVLIDGGTQGTLSALKCRFGAKGKPTPLDLLVVTHVDSDHIGGALALLAEAKPVVKPAEVWFNGYKHLFRGRLGGVQGEALSTAIADAGLAKAWNKSFKGQSVVVPDKGPLPTVDLPGDAQIVLLSPTWDKLETLQKPWAKAVKDAGLEPGQGAKPSDVLGKRAMPAVLDVTKLAKDPFRQDSSAPNGSSIAFLFRYKGKQILCCADAHPGVIVASLKRLAKTPIAIDACKLPHHCSRANVGPALLEAIACEKFLVSTNGDVFGHPDPEAIARVVARPGEKNLIFNYATDRTKPWAKAALCDQYHYATDYAEDEERGSVITLA